MVEPVSKAGVLIRAAAFAAALLSGASTVLFAFAWYDRYWRWRGCFNELGRCFDPETQEVHLEQAGVVWGSLALVSLSVLVVCLLMRLRR